MKVRQLLASAVVAAGVLLFAAAPATAAPAGASPAAPPAAKAATGSAPRAGIAPQSLLGPYRFKSSYNNRCMDADLNTIGGNGTKVQLWDCLGANQNNQGWYFESTATVGVYRVRSQYNVNKCLDADLNTIAGNGTKVQLWDCIGTGQANQLWTLISTRFGNVYHLTSRYNGRCLDADLNTIAGNGTKVQLWDCFGDNQLNQDWYFG
jgi:predicted RNA-binding protein